MVSDRLGLILQELSRLINVPNLEADKNSSCLLRLPSGLKIQIELDRDDVHLLIGIEIGPAPAGAFRSRLFQRALQINGLSAPRFGILAYSRQIKSLIMFERLPLKTVSAGDIAELMELMIPKAQMWVDALDSGQLPDIPSAPTTPEEGSGLFGLKH
jgi:hypothetical protein